MFISDGINQAEMNHKNKVMLYRAFLLWATNKDTKYESAKITITNFK